ncbi:HupE/UreJ family protein [Paraconexibacter algicola]|uniref:HupE/UreJ family protein n=1 Tax=Paraconexibacter algicola TaxID=2133960 RepID=A0A2T4UM34_9ACTN|nr:HupE/UreJ family protein [Paraconexibacter algicola]PTL60268.1 hypothetical protein C7Y72_11775 [Paraconexibacter algicola]
MTLPARGRLCAAAGLALLLLPATAAAHGISGDATDKTTLEYVPLGIEHMLLGWDHLLFVLGIVLLARAPMRAAKLISFFVAGHSFTLIVATLAEWRVSPTLVDVAIALSVVFVAALGLQRERLDDRAVWPAATTLGFGLIHGLGLSTRLQDLGIPDDGLLGKTIAFNVGVEIGQLVAVLIMFAIVFLLAKRIARWTEVRRSMFAVIGVAGLLAAVVLAVQGEDDQPNATPDRNVSSATAGVCTTVDETPVGGLAGQHPAKKFFGPAEQVPEEDLAHVRGDGWVIVRYSATATPAQVRALQTWIDGSDRAIAAAPDPKQRQALVATTARRKMSCQRHDVSAIKQFAAAWLEDVKAGRIQ